MFPFPAATPPKKIMSGLNFELTILLLSSTVLLYMYRSLIVLGLFFFCTLYNGLRQHVFFGDWLFSLNIVLSSSLEQHFYFHFCRVFHCINEHLTKLVVVPFYFSAINNLVTYFLLFMCTSFSKLLKPRHGIAGERV